MAVRFHVDVYWYEIGSGDFLYSFFSTVAYRLEKKHWGKRFPTIMNDLYSRGIGAEQVKEAISELRVIQTELEKFSPDQVIWDIDDLGKQPPWGNDISPDITNLSNYFVTGDGEDFLSVFMNALQEASESGVGVEIEAI